MIIQNEKKEKDAIFYCYAIDGYITIKACAAFCMIFSNCSAITKAMQEIRNHISDKNIQVLEIEKNPVYNNTEVKNINQGRLSETVNK